MTENRRPFIGDRVSVWWPSEGWVNGRIRSIDDHDGDARIAVDDGRVIDVRWEEIYPERDI